MKKYLVLLFCLVAFVVAWFIIGSVVLDDDKEQEQEQGGEKYIVNYFPRLQAERKVGSSEDYFCGSGTSSSLRQWQNMRHKKERKRKKKKNRSHEHPLMYWLDDWGYSPPIFERTLRHITEALSGGSDAHDQRLARAQCEIPVTSWAYAWCQVAAKRKAEVQCNATHVPCLAARAFVEPVKREEFECRAGGGNLVRCYVVRNTLLGIGYADGVETRMTMWRGGVTNWDRVFKSMTTSMTSWMTVHSDESSAAYPYAEDVAFLHHFDVVYGHDRRFADRYSNLYMLPLRDLFDKLLKQQQQQEQEQEQAPLIGDIERKGMAVYVQSHCGLPRDRLVRDLMDALPADSIHSYGKCVNTHSIEMSRWDFRDALKLYRHYDFVLAFENDQCPWYVTEKLFNAFLAGVIPVYLGAANINQFLPHPKSIISVRDFDTVEQLASHLVAVSQSPKEYSSYLQWRNEPDVLRHSPLYALVHNNTADAHSLKCAFCELLNSVAV
jgi:Glycosyltransferase family 10 (fucosyltransferase) C-term